VYYLGVSKGVEARAADDVGFAADALDPGGAGGAKRARADDG